MKFVNCTRMMEPPPPPPPPPKRSPECDSGIWAAAMRRGKHFPAAAAGPCAQRRTAGEEEAGAGMREGGKEDEEKEEGGKEEGGEGRLGPNPHVAAGASPRFSLTWEGAAGPP